MTSKTVVICHLSIVEQPQFYFLDYNRIQKAIPKDWLSVIKHDVHNEDDMIVKLIGDNVKCMKIILSVLIEPHGSMNYDEK